METFAAAIHRSRCVPHQQVPASVVCWPAAMASQPLPVNWRSEARRPDRLLAQARFCSMLVSPPMG